MLRNAGNIEARKSDHAPPHRHWAPGTPSANAQRQHHPSPDALVRCVPDTFFHGMAIVVPKGSREDPSRAPSFYDPARQLLSEIGVPAL